MAIEKEFHWRYNTYGMVRWGLSAFKKGWEAGKTDGANPFWDGRGFPGMKAGIWQRGKEAYRAWALATKARAT